MPSNYILPHIAEQIRLFGFKNPSAEMKQRTVTAEPTTNSKIILICQGFSIFPGLLHLLLLIYLMVEEMLR